MIRDNDKESAEVVNRIDCERTGDDAGRSANAIDRVTDEEKIAKFQEVQRYLWNGALGGNALVSCMCAAIIRNLQIPGPDGEDPADA